MSISSGPEVQGRAGCRRPTSLAPPGVENSQAELSGSWSPPWLTCLLDFLPFPPPLTFPWSHSYSGGHVPPGLPGPTWATCAAISEPASGGAQVRTVTHRAGDGGTGWRGDPFRTVWETPPKDTAKAPVFLP